MAGVTTVRETPSLKLESLENCARDEQVSHTLPSLAPPPQAVPQLAAQRVSLVRWLPKALPSYNFSGVPRQRNMAQMKEQSNTSELSHEEIASTSEENLKP